jgi:hypothetical protein
MSNEQIAALLEVVSFFFVGIDLYGPERLGKAQNRLLIASEYLHDKINHLQGFEWRKQRRNKFMLIVYTINIGLTAYWLESGLGFISEIKTASIGEIIGGTFLFVFGYGFALMLFLMAIVFSMGLLNVLISVINYCVKALVKILKSYQMEGVFLFIGTTLFLISKYVQFYY